MKVLITGGAGFVGSHLADALLARGDSVLVIDNYSTGRRDNLKAQQRLTVVEGSVADPDLVEQTFDDFGPDVVVHAAASYKDPDNWYDDSLTNVTGTVNITQATARVGARRLIYFQTALCYGLTPTEQPITITHPLNLEGSSYAISKTAGERYIAMSGLDYVSFRLANAYGPRNLSGPLPIFYQRLSEGKGCFVMNTRRDFIYVAELVAIVVKALDGRGEPGCYHVSSGSDFAIIDLFRETVTAMGLPADTAVEERERAPDDAFSILLDPSVTNEMFDWKIETPLAVGVKKAIDYYRTHGLGETYTHLKTKE